MIKASPVPRLSPSLRSMLIGRTSRNEANKRLRVLVGLNRLC
jgi:hypothetical protein